MRQCENEKRAILFSGEKWKLIGFNSNQVKVKLRETTNYCHSFTRGIQWQFVSSLIFQLRTKNPPQSSPLFTAMYYRTSVFCKNGDWEYHISLSPLLKAEKNNAMKISHGSNNVLSISWGKFPISMDDILPNSWLNTFLFFTTLEKVKSRSRKIPVKKATVFSFHIDRSPNWNDIGVPVKWR